jgi:methionyl-tRNA synthetase
MEKYIYFTTPIFYPNSKPHLGNAYTLIIADFFKRYYTIQGYKCLLATGTDEHGKKVAEAALAQGLSPQEHVDIQRKNFFQLNDVLKIQWDQFIYTSHPQHKATAQAFWMYIYNKGLIYKGTYKGWYSQRDEQYFKESDLIDGKAPTGAPVQLMEEECYFFKLTQFKEAILKFYQDNPQAIAPQWRLKEIINNLQNNSVDDLCISRHKSQLSWGIPVPNDDDHVMYVWFDALTNYLTTINYPQYDKNYWHNGHHIIGKDIAYFHGIIWPAMLMAADIPVFKQLIIHGWLTVNQEKMSKSLGNVIDPQQLCSISSDYLKYFLLREIPISSDYNFDLCLVAQRVNEELADKLGNLINRVINMVEKYCNSIIPQGTLAFHWDDQMLHDFVEKREINNYCGEVLQRAIEINKYIENQSPWRKDLDEATRHNILYNCCWGIHQLAGYLGPITPDFSQKILDSLGCTNYHESIVGKTVVHQGILIEKIKLEDGLLVKIN